MRWKQRVEDISLKNKIILINTLVVLIMLSGAIVSIAVIIKNYNELIYKTTFDNLKLSTAGIDKKIEEIERLSEYIVSDNTVQEELNNIKESESPLNNKQSRINLTGRIYKYAGSDTAIKSISLIDEKGYQMSSSIEKIIANQVVDAAKVLAYEYDGKVTWYIPRDNNGNIICIREIRKIKDLALTSLGTVMIRIDLEKVVNESLQKLLKGENLQSGKMYIFHDDKVIYPISEEISSQEEVNIVKEKGYSISTIGGIKYLMTYNKLTEVDLTYALLIPYDNIYKVRSNSNKIILFMSMMLLTSTTTLSIFLVNKINEHFIHLIKGMKRFKGDNFIDSLEYKKYEERKDEIGFLHNAFYEMAKDIDQLVNEGLKKQILIKDTQISHLVSQINPHFLYNTLNSINWIAKMNQQTQISEMVEALAILMRAAISDKSDFITLGKELEIVRGYTFIQKVRYEERLDFKIEVEEELLDIQIPKLCIQPLVENSINHVLEHMIETCFIKVKASVEGKKLIIRVWDSGPGVDGDILEQLETGKAKPKHTGIGLGNIQKRIELLYGEKEAMTFRKVDSGGEVQIQIPLNR